MDSILGIPIVESRFVPPRQALLLNGQLLVGKGGAWQVELALFRLEIRQFCRNSAFARRYPEIAA